MSAGTLVALHGGASSVVLEWQPAGPPLWRHWGPRLPDDGLPPYLLAEARYLPPSSLDAELPLSLLPAFGVGGFAPPALLAHRAGRQFAHAFEHCTLRRTPGGLHFTLRDGVARIAVELTLTLDSADVLRIDTRLINEGDVPLSVQAFASATLPLPAHARAVRSLHGQWSNEFRWHEDTLGPSTWQRENRRGRAGHDGFMGAIVVAEGATADAGA